MKGKGAMKREGYGDEEREKKEGDNRKSEGH